MLERETELLLNAIARSTIGNRDGIFLSELLSADVPDGIKVYIQAEVRRWLEQEFSAAPKLSRLDRTLPEADKKMRILLHSLAPSYRFRREEYLAILDHAVHFVGSYLCRPRWTLEHLVFDNAMRVSTRQVLARLDYVADYRYFAILLEKVIRRHNWSELGIEDFQRLVQRIDSEVIQQHNARELAQLTRPIFKFLKPIAEDQRGAIPIEPLLAFLDDKEKHALHDYVEAVCRIRGREKITLDEFADIAEDLLSGKTTSPLAQEPASPPPVASPAPLPPPPVITATAPVNAAPLPAPELASEPAPVEDIEDIIDEPASAPLPAPAHPEPATREVEQPTVPTPKPAPAAETLQNRNIALSLTFAGLQETQSAAPAPPPARPGLQASFSQADRRHLAASVFHKDEEYVESVIEVLNSMDTWKEASLHLNRLYQLHQLDPFQPDVVRFTDVVQQWFMKGTQ